MYLITAKDVKVTGGEFRVLLPEDLYGSLRSSEDAGTLVVACRFSLIGEDGSTLATGVVTNGEPVGGLKIELSPETLEEFSKFFKSLQEDIRRELAGIKKNDDKSQFEKVVELFSDSNVVDAEGGES